MVFLKTRPFVKWNNTEFSVYFASYMQHTLYTVFGILTFFPPHQQQFLKFVWSEIPGESAWQVLFRPPCCFFILWHLKVIRT